MGLHAGRLAVGRARMPVAPFPASGQATGSCVCHPSPTESHLALTKAPVVALITPMPFRSFSLVP